MHIDHFKEHFQTIIDQRQEAKVTYCLFEGLFGSLCAVITGAKVPLNEMSSLAGADQLGSFYVQI
ncbi:hypothetical protein AYY27_04330 [Photobacterium damselae]|nr:hypothetical protein AYY27_04330 [Photobacterium damselae]